MIRIIREEDEPKPVLMKRFKLTDIQAEAILNMRLRSLRKLEEIRDPQGARRRSSKEQKQLEALLDSEDKQWETIAGEIGEVRKTFGPDTPLGKRRTDLRRRARARRRGHPDGDGRARAGHRHRLGEGLDPRAEGPCHRHSALTFKDGDSAEARVPGRDHRQDPGRHDRRQVLHARRRQAAGRARPWRADPLMVDMENGQDIVTVFVHEPERKLLLVSTEGNGFVVPEAEVVANTRKGKQVMNVDAPEESASASPPSGDHVAIVGENRKMLVFPLDQVPEMTRGKGVRLQRYKDGGVADARVFAKADGLTWVDSSGRTFTRPIAELKDWIGDRAQAGRLPPQGFPRNNRFGTAGIS